jgi:hypothetical protein
MALGAAAAVTARVRLGAGICVALMYDPIILAMQVATLDQRLAIDRPVDRLILMGPGGIGTTRALPTKGLNSLLNYFGGKGPARNNRTNDLDE